MVESWRIHGQPCMESQEKHFLHNGRGNSDSLSLVRKSVYEQYQKPQQKQNHWLWEKLSGEGVILACVKMRVWD